MNNRLHPVLRLIALIGLFTTPGIHAQNPDITVGDISFPSLRWGEQQAVVPLHNNSDYIRFVVAETDIRFDGAYLHPQRRVLSYHALPPGESDTIHADILIPGNFGKAQAKLSLYNVIDTLDDVLPSQKFFEQPLSLTFHIPSGLQPYAETRITLPPRVETHPYFDNEFSRLLIVLMSEGKSVEQIAALAECDTSFVKSQISILVGQGYARATDTSAATLAISVIRAAEAEAAREKAIKLADSLATVISGRMDRLVAARDSLVAAGAVSEDSAAFFDPGTVLYHTYPTIGGLAIWFDLGNTFITRSAPFLLYDGTDMCNAKIPVYMYAVEGGPVVNGQQFYALVHNPGSYNIYFGDTIPVVHCQPDFMLFASAPNMVSYYLAESNQPTVFMVDTAVVRPAIEAVTGGLDTLLFSVYTELRDMAVDKYGHPRLDYGYRYWFWNLVATRTLDLLVEQGVLRREGNGQFQFSGMVTTAQ